MTFQNRNLDLEESEEVRFGNVPVYSNVHGQAVPMPQSQLYLDRVNTEYLKYANINALQRKKDNNHKFLDKDLYMNDQYAGVCHFNNLCLMNIREYASCVQLKDITTDEFAKDITWCCWKPAIHPSVVGIYCLMSNLVCRA